MMDKVIVTIKNQELDFTEDLELQANVRIRELNEPLRKALIGLYPDKFAGTKSLELIYQNEKISDDDTLASKGVWDGSVVELIVRR